MKIIRFTVLFFVGLFLSPTAHSQNCAPCTNDSSLLTPGFTGLNLISCIVQGQPYNDTILFRVPDKLVEFGDTLNVDSVHLLDITNLPCGLCWSAQTPLESPPLNVFIVNQTGCIVISGTTFDTTGQFKLALTLYGYFGGVSKPVLPSTLDTDGLILILRVVAPGGNCQPVDTSAGAVSMGTNPNRCATGVNDMQGYITLFDVFPNPVNSGAVVSFTAIKSGDYILKLTDVTGKVTRAQQIQAHTGSNQVELPRANLPAGLYFISIGNEEGMITRKLLVTE